MEGLQVIDQLQRVEQTLQEEADRVEREFDAGEERLDDVIAQRGQTFVELARHYFPAIDQDAVDRSFAGLKDDLANVLNRKRRELRRLRARISDLNEPRREQKAELEQVTSALNEQVRQRDVLEKQLADRLAADDAFASLVQQVVDAEQRLQQNEQRVAEIQREAEEKLPAYQDSKLFMYLYDRGFGTPQYRAWTLTRRIDAWIASMIDFRRARKSYEFLLVTPKLMAEEVVRRRTECKELADRLDTTRAAQFKTIGLDSVMLEGDRLGQQRERLVAELERSDIELDALEDELATIEQSRGRFYEEAIERLKKLLESTSTAVLQRRASQTPEPQDDEIVAEIQWLEQQADELRTQIRESRDSQRNIERQQRGIAYVLRRCREADVDSERCYFDESLDLQEEIQRFTQGTNDQHEFVIRLREHQQFRPTWSDKALERTTDTLQKPGVQMLLQLVAVAGGSLLRHFLLNQRSGHRSSDAKSRRSAKRFTSGPGF